jgi:hypothetical protein
MVTRSAPSGKWEICAGSRTFVPDTIAVQLRVSALKLIQRIRNRTARKQASSASFRELPEARFRTYFFSANARKSSVRFQASAASAAR